MPENSGPQFEEAGTAQAEASVPAAAPGAAAAVDRAAVEAPAAGTAAGPPVLSEEDLAPPTNRTFDWVTEVAIPLVILGMLGSLLYFLIEWRNPKGSEFRYGLRLLGMAYLAATIGIARLRLWARNLRQSSLAGELRVYVVVFGVLVAGVAAWAVWRLTMVQNFGALIHQASQWGPTASLVLNLLIAALIWFVADLITRECTQEENFRRSLEEGLLADSGRSSQRSGKPARHPGNSVLWTAAGALVLMALGAHTLGDSRRFDEPSMFIAGFVFFAGLLLALTHLSAVRMDVRQRRLVVNRGLVSTWIATSLVIVLLIATVALPVYRGPHFGQGTGGDWSPPPWGRERPAGISGPDWGMGQPDQTPTKGTESQAPGKGQQTEGGQGSSGGPGGGGGGGGSEGSGGAASTASSGGGGGQSSSQASGGGGGGGGAAQGAEAARSKTSKDNKGGGPRDNWWWLILLLILLAILIYLLIRYRKEVAEAWRALMAPFYALWLAFLAFLERLRRRLGLRSGAEAEWADLPEDPFADLWGQRDLASNLTPAQIVRHVYRAFLALCSLRGFPRPEYQTELEFLRLVRPEVLDEVDQATLTRSYVYAAYSLNEVPPSMVENAREIWGRLRPAIDQALAVRPGNA
jgi:uncharacterized membrane protein YgcG